MFNRIKRTLSEAVLRVVYAIDEEAREAAEDAHDCACVRRCVEAMKHDPDCFVSGDDL